MASDIAKRYAAQLQAIVAKWGDATSIHHYEAAIDRAIRASHAQRTRRENEALDWLVKTRGERWGAIAAECADDKRTAKMTASQIANGDRAMEASGILRAKAALRRARRGSK